MIAINNLTASSFDEEFLKKVAKKVMQGEHKEDADLSIVFVGQGRMRELNKKYRGKNKVTDILSFPGNGLGELVICLREVKKNARRYQESFEKELTRVLIHGILHLLGYKHEKSDAEKDKMRKKEEYYLSKIK